MAQVPRFILGCPLFTVSRVMETAASMLLNDRQMIDIDWAEVSKALGGSPSPRDCKALWKYCAYNMGKDGSSLGRQVDVHDDSDVEVDIGKVPPCYRKIRAPKRVAKKRPYSQGSKRTKWTTVMDRVLVEAVRAFGVGDDKWPLIANSRDRLRHLSGPDCKARFAHLRDAIPKKKYNSKKVVEEMNAFLRDEALRGLISVEPPAAAAAPTANMSTPVTATVAQSNSAVNFIPS